MENSILEEASYSPIDSSLNFILTLFENYIKFHKKAIADKRAQLAIEAPPGP